MPLNAISASDRTPVDPLEIRATPPNLSSVALKPQPFMIEPIDQTKLFSFQKYPEKFSHEEFDEIIDIDCLRKTKDQPVQGINKGFKAFAPSGEQYYVKITRPEHAFAQRAARELYELFWMKKNRSSPTPRNFLGFSKVGNGNMAFCAIVSIWNPNLKKLCDIQPEHQEEAHKMLEPSGFPI